MPSNAKICVRSQKLLKDAKTPAGVSLSATLNLDGTLLTIRAKRHIRGCATYGFLILFLRTHFWPSPTSPHLTRPPPSLTHAGLWLTKHSTKWDELQREGSFLWKMIGGRECHCDLLTQHSLVSFRRVVPRAGAEQPELSRSLSKSLKHTLYFPPDGKLFLLAARWNTNHTNAAFLCVCFRPFSLLLFFFFLLGWNWGIWILTGLLVSFVWPHSGNRG